MLKAMDEDQSDGDCFLWLEDKRIIGHCLCRANKNKLDAASPSSWESGRAGLLALTSLLVRGWTQAERLLLGVPYLAMIGLRAEPLPNGASLRALLDI